MNVENATSDESTKIDEDLVAALGFEPASDILIVDDALNDDLSISSDDIRVSTKEPVSDLSKASSPTSPKADVRPPSKKSNKGRNKSKVKGSGPTVSSTKSNLVDRLNADSKTADALKTSSPSAKSPSPTADAGTVSGIAKTSAGPVAESDSKPKTDNKSKSSVAKADSKKSSASGDKAKDNSGFSVAPPPPIAANAVLLSEPSPATYGFSDVKLPDIKGAFAKFTRRDGKTDAEEASVIANAEALTAEVSAVTTKERQKSADAQPKGSAPAQTESPVAESVIDARVAESPPKVGGTPPVLGGPATSPPSIDPDPGIQIVEEQLEPNVYRAPTKSGRTRIRSRKVRRQVRHIDPWSVLTFSVIFHACVFGALLLASVLVWRFADGAGLIEKTESFWAELADKPDFEIDQGVLVRAAAMIAGLLAIASSVMMVLLTVFFNLISDIVGGIRVTVIEEEPVRVTK